MYGNEVTDDLERTAFRKAEKRYKLYYDPNSRKKKQPRAVDLSEVIDFKSISDNYTETGKTPDGVRVILGERIDHPVFRLDNRPGFYFIPGALSLEEQCHWIRESLATFPQPPNRTNHNAIYGPIQDLFTAAQQGKTLVESDDLPQEVKTSKDEQTQRWEFVDKPIGLLKGNGGKSVLASTLMRKLRWSTLGLQFDWSKRNYDVSLPHNIIPRELGQLAMKLAGPAMPPGDEFKPEAAIVNYFGSGDTLGGHLDDMEVDWSKPIVSMSLGCKAIFLLGGKSRNDEPVAMFLRSGDVVLMSGEARECFHGVPRIFTDPQHSEITDLEKHLSSDGDTSFLEYVTTSRININIRQVF